MPLEYRSEIRETDVSFEMKQSALYLDKRNIKLVPRNLFRSQNAQTTLPSLFTSTRIQGTMMRNLDAEISGVLPPTEIRAVLLLLPRTTPADPALRLSRELK